MQKPVKMNTTYGCGYIDLLFLAFMCPIFPPSAVATLIKRMTAKPAAESQLGIGALQFCQHLCTTLECYLYNLGT